MDQEKIGKFIAILRKKKGLTQSQLGDLLGISDKSVSKWERGINAPDISILKDLSSILDISILELLNGEKECNADVNIDAINFYNKRLKIKYIKSFFIILVLISIFFSIIYFISNYNKYHIYSISSRSPNFDVSGQLVLNKNKNIIMINRIGYIDRYAGTDKELFVHHIKLYLKCDDKILYQSGYHSENIETKSRTAYPISNLISNEFIYVVERIDKDDVHIDKIESCLKIEVEYEDYYGELGKLDIPLSVVK